MQHCLASFWRQTNFKISLGLGNPSIYLCFLTMFVRFGSANSSQDICGLDQQFFTATLLTGQWLLLAVFVKRLKKKILGHSWHLFWWGNQSCTNDLTVTMIGEAISRLPCKAQFSAKHRETTTFQHCAHIWYKMVIWQLPRLTITAHFGGNLIKNRIM